MTAVCNSSAVFNHTPSPKNRFSLAQATRQDSRASRFDTDTKSSVFPGLVTVKTKENCEPANQVKITATTLRKIHSAWHQPRPPVGVCHAWGGAAVGGQHSLSRTLTKQ